MTIPVVRKRVKKPKVRTGCRTCRTRRVKCDEQGFPCLRCRKSGRACEGYDLTTKADMKKNRNAAILPRDAGSPSPGRHMRIMRVALDSAESNAFDFFRREAIWQLPGSLLEWDKLVLQASYDEPAMTHAAIAIGFLVSSTPGSEDDLASKNERRRLALRHYSKAIGFVDKIIGSIQKMSSETGIEVVLLTSLLFFCFEILSGADLCAIVHFRTALRILYSQVQTYPGTGEKTRRKVILKPTPRTRMDLLINTFVRLDLDDTLAECNTPFLHPVVVERLPTYFSSLEEAKVHLDALSNAIYGIFREVDELGRIEVATSQDISHLSEEQLFCLANVTARLLPTSDHPDSMDQMSIAQQDLKAWASALALLPYESKSSASRLMIQIEYFDLWLNTCIWKDENETMADRLNSDFAHLLHLAEQYVDLQTVLCPRSDGTRSITRPAFAIGTKLVPCIASISWKCRDPVTRRGCIELIRRINQQGVSDSDYLATVCETVVDLEETAARNFHGKDDDEELSSSDIAEEVRILELEMCNPSDQEDFWKAEEGRIVFVKFSDGAGSELQLHEATFLVQRESSGTPKRMTME